MPRKPKPLAEQFATLDDPPPAPAAEPLQLLDEPERPPVEWPVAERTKRSMPITLRFMFLVFACVCFLLAGLNALVSPKVKFIGLGLFFWTLSLMVPTP
jgi:hypothetical protein